LEAIFSFQKYPDVVWGPTSLLFKGYLKHFPRGVKRSEREGDGLPPTSAETKSEADLSVSYMPSWHLQGQLYRIFTTPVVTVKKPCSLLTQCIYFSSVSKYTLGKTMNSQPSFELGISRKHVKRAVLLHQPAQSKRD